MKVPKAAPGEGPQKVRDHFPHWSIGGGERHFAYSAGPTAWVMAHPSDKGTKPCLRLMTSNALPCRFCAMGKVEQRVGYVPVYRGVDWKPMCVIVYDEEQEWLDEIGTHDRIQIGREREKGARLWVRRCMEQEPKYCTTIERRQHAQEVDDSMLTLWKMPELVAWLQSGRPSDNAVSLPVDKPIVMKGSNGDPIADTVDTSPPKKVNTGRAKKVPYDEVLERLKARGAVLGPSANGKHDAE